MLNLDFLNLNCVKLQAPEEWTQKGQHLLFLFPTAGGGKWLGEGWSSRPIAAGDVLVLNAASGGKLCAGDDGMVEFSCFSLSLEQFYPLFESGEICLLDGIANGFRSSKIYPAGSAVAQECHRRLSRVPSESGLDQRSSLLQVATGILAHEFKMAKGERAAFVRPEQHVAQMFTELTSLELINLSVVELAKKFGCSRRHLNRLFHLQFGVSFSALRMEMRMLRSVTLLRDPEAKIIRVAEDCGFNQVGLFNICFKRRFGTSPGQWRKQFLKADHDREQPKSIATACPLNVKGFCPVAGIATSAALLKPGQVAASQKTGAARLVVSGKVAKGNGNGERKPAVGQPMIPRNAQKPVLVRIRA